MQVKKKKLLKNPLIIHAPPRPCAETKKNAMCADTNQITASGVTLSKWAPWRAPDDGMLIVTKNFSLDFK